MPSIPSTPPTCLQNFVCRAVRPSDVGLPVDAAFRSYALGCPCGQDQWSVLGNWFEDGSCFVGPLVARCTSCGWHQRLVDLLRDGYDASVGSGIDEGPMSRDTWVCGRCGNAAGRIAASLGYQYEEDADEQGRRHDLFDAFILTHLCPNGDARVEIAVFECA